MALNTSVAKKMSLVAENAWPVTCMTAGPKHHFFGFHDLPNTSVGGRWLGLAVDRVDRPPMGEDVAEVITWTAGGFAPRVLTRTRNYNFPQGARQHWLGQSETVIVNEEGPGGAPVARLYDGADGSRIGQISQSTACSDRKGLRSYTVDFGRLHRLGGYGHSNMVDRSSTEVSPADNGVYVTDIAADRSKLLLSIDAVRVAAGLDAASTGAHFITHLRLSPDDSRLAFLHRFRLADGGEETCLWTVGTDGSNLRLLLRGFLSHFDWLDTGRIMIWGRRNQGLAAIRRSPLLGNPVARALLPLVKTPLRKLLGRSRTMSMSYLEIADAADSEPAPYAPNSLRMDGHPMLNPAHPSVILTDTYPNEAGVRELMLYHEATQTRTDLGVFRKLDDEPTKEILAEVTAHLKATLDVAMPTDIYAFTRSGLHCDLHPRWSADGKTAAFDSIHEGSRQIYAIDVSRALCSRGTVG
ncbi:hypothetical protein [Loktanella salsilacus]|uniref:hypothetical protein n=1 Tax=Loktanella salsilacus TaxID=195913 RepID=UPI0037366691